MPHNGIPIGCYKNRSASRIQDAKCLRKNAVNIGNVFGNLRTYHDIKGRICLIYFSCVTDCI